MKPQNVFVSATLRRRLLESLQVAMLFATAVIAFAITGVMVFACFLGPGLLSLAYFYATDGFAIFFVVSALPICLLVHLLSPVRCFTYNCHAVCEYDSVTKPCSAPIARLEWRIVNSRRRSMFSWGFQQRTILLMKFPKQGPWISLFSPVIVIDDETNITAWKDRLCSLS
jgi:hypothetical protein